MNFLNFLTSGASRTKTHNISLQLQPPKPNFPPSSLSTSANRHRPRGLVAEPRTEIPTLVTEPSKPTAIQPVYAHEPPAAKPKAVNPLKALIIKEAPLQIQRLKHSPLREQGYG